MKLTTAALLAFAASSVLGNPISFKATPVSARDLHERDGGEGFSESFEKRGGASPSLLKSIIDMIGIMGGRVANSSTQNAIGKKFFPPAKPAASATPSPEPAPQSPPHPAPQSPPHLAPQSPSHHAPQSPPHQVLLKRRSLEARMKRRALSRPVARAFAPGQAIKNVVTSVSNADGT